jgi:putative aminopeptidase FrvX
LEIQPVKELIKRLTEAYGPSGREGEVRWLIQEEIQGLVDEIRTDALGNLIALKKGSQTSPENEAPRKVMLAAHMDEIGLVVSHVDEKGFLRFAPVGGLYRLTLVGARALFANGVVGVINVEKWDNVKEIPDLDKLYLDVGARDAASAPVKVGDIASFQRTCVEAGERLIAKAMDDRIGCTVLVQVIREVSGRAPIHDAYFVFTVQEEVGLRGAVTSAYGVAPDLAIAVDVTATGDLPESRPMNVVLGKGPAIKVKDRGMLAHPGVKDLLISLAERQGIPHQLEVLELGTTDAMAIQTSREGVPTGAVSIPCRHIHTSSEMVDYQDVLNSVRLLAALLFEPLSIK